MGAGREGTETTYVSLPTRQNSGKMYATAFEIAYGWGKKKISLGCFKFYSENQTAREGFLPLKEQNIICPQATLSCTLNEYLI